jgi:signal transduction histidine kinase
VRVTVKVTDGPDDKSALLVVRDEGVGIPQHDLPHIFDRSGTWSGASREPVLGSPVRVTWWSCTEAPSP